MDQIKIVKNVKTYASVTKHELKIYDSELKIFIQKYIKELIKI